MKRASKSWDLAPTYETERESNPIQKLPRVPSDIWKNNYFRMKRAMLVAGIALVAVVSGCNKIKQLANINVDIPYSYQAQVPPVAGDSQTFVLPGGGATLSFPSAAVATNSKQYMQQYGTAANLIVEVDLKSLAIRIQSPPNQNFDFLDNIYVYLSANSLPEMLVASESNIPKGSTTLNLVTNTEVNLKDYFLKDTIYFRLVAHINAVPPAGENLNIASVFHMLANPLE
jgi:hypothetical protein